MLFLQRDENLGEEKEEEDENEEKKNRWSVPVLQDVLVSQQPISLF